MNSKSSSLLLIFCIFAIISCSNSETQELQAQTKNTKNKGTKKMTVEKTEEEWKKILSPEQYRILREKGTERPWSGEYNDTKEAGAYHCAACDALLFESDTKFDSHCGWPSFYQAAAGDKVTTEVDRTHGMVRTEIMCAACGGHLGHVFDDGPKPTGLRYCVNSVSLLFKPSKK
ncbi:MAG: peptide-methionine (R)-S-oxide reductase MsrB [Candidatus Kapabacteria bacterium]|nr:peptide-methionine (R)-S-oxide reductase MsrB [Candidatus Kapabacteria bacterium]